MPRQARNKGEFCTYHIIQRGNEKKKIFLSEEDKIRFIETLVRMKDKYKFLIYAYCLMDNHVHLVIYDNGNDISQLLKSVNISYVIYFNRKYKRCGHLFQDRFKSELIEDDKYLLEVSKYIHNNPVKARMVKKPEEYKWSSYNIYTGKMRNEFDLIDTDKILGNISDIRRRAIKEYINYVSQKEASDFEVMDIEDSTVSNAKENSEFICSIEQAREKMKEFTKNRNLTYATLLSDKKMRDELIIKIRENSSLTLKQIGELFGGISESRVSRILSKRTSQEPSLLD